MRYTAIVLFLIGVIIYVKDLIIVRSRINFPPTSLIILLTSGIFYLAYYFHLESVLSYIMAFFSGFFSVFILTKGKATYKQKKVPLMACAITLITAVIFISIYGPSPVQLK